MDKETILKTIWLTVWNCYKKRLDIETVADFTGEHYFEALRHLKKNANKLGYKVKLGRKYIRLVKEQNVI